MEKNKIEEHIEHYIAQAFFRKGENETLDAFKKIDSADEIRQLVDNAELKYQRGLGNRITSRIWIGISSFVAVAMIVLIVGLQPLYTTDELYTRWSKKIVYESVVSRGENEAQETFEVALALANAGKSEQAIEHFMLILANHTSEYTEDARWYLALTYLRIGERDKAKANLQTIITNNEEYAVEANELLNEINQKRWF